MGDVVKFCAGAFVGVQAMTFYLNVLADRREIRRTLFLLIQRVDISSRRQADQLRSQHERIKEIEKFQEETRTNFPRKTWNVHYKKPEDSELLNEPLFRAQEAWSNRRFDGSQLLEGLSFCEIYPNLSLVVVAVVSGFFARQALR